MSLGTLGGSLWVLVSSELTSLGPFRLVTYCHFPGIVDVSSQSRP